MRELTVLAVVAAGSAVFLCGCIGSEFDCERTQWIYTVKQDDTLWSIAEKTYGYGIFWVYIANANQVTPSQPVQVGRKLVVPCVQRSAQGKLTPPKECKPRRIR
ncbi:MAG TPA: LysM domain-containing protein [Phycisphaerae bacterium]|nr:LysM domain-containing protein [Phycisphaerae bacterium]